MNYEIDLNKTSTQPLTLKVYNDYVDRIFRKRKEDPYLYKGPRIDPMKLLEAGVPFHQESEDLILLSTDGYKKAVELGLIELAHVEETSPSSPLDSVASPVAAPTGQSSVLPDKNPSKVRASGRPKP